MRVVFVSNFMSHHQQPFCDAMAAQDGVDFTFVATKPLSQNRRNMGWKEADALPYEIRAYEGDAARSQALDAVRGADVAIFGYDGADEFFKAFMKETNGLAVRCSERLYKNGRWRAISPRGMLLRFKSYGVYPKKRMYLLCSSAYTAGDYAMLGSYRNRCYRWGYFPPFVEQDIHETIAKKEPNSLLWAGRLLSVKHPETVLVLAQYLKKKGMPFHINVLGDGPLRETLESEIARLNLCDCVHLRGSLSPEETRDYMQRAQFFLATSDYGEGWGAVVNEAMNSGCVVVGSDAMGAVPFLLQDGENGLVYKYGAFDAICERVAALLTEDDTRNAMGVRAYETIATEWNAQVAARRLVELLQALRGGEKKNFDGGPCSVAPRL